MKKKRRKRNSYTDICAYADAKLVAFRKKALTIIRREFRGIESRLPTTSELVTRISRVESDLVAHVEDFKEFVQRVDDRFDDSAN